MSAEDPALLAAIHHAFIEPLRQVGRAPTVGDVARDLGMTPTDVTEALLQLQSRHGIVLHPHNNEPWVIHPFSLSPTATWVETDTVGWWAPCLWCAFGIVGLAGGTAGIHTRLGGERDSVRVNVVNGKVERNDLVVHFSVPPRDAWNNVHHFCGTVLAFSNASEVPAWSARHALALGEVVPVQTVADLGRQWYARHCEPDWRKWTGAQGGAIFDGVGLTGPFWQFDRSERPF
jgi:hypothetical protein